MYDMQASSHQLLNLWGNPEYGPIIPELMQRMLKWFMGADTDRPYRHIIGT